ncbi:MFS general substrate transporter [Piedraia hortae CBS 480.64]|uniref:MFS general substrate transporter n=1 Tax=Piedraia hortae CBS 480.64 TaxID=1314780 RepID=A0A6A7C0J4_9PEZI|nr:MFS general substrate transporter [Piedraia hortae CBS 480.64]
MVSVLSYCSFLAPAGSTSILAAAPEVASHYNVSGDVFDISNALFMVFMALSGVFYGPMAQSVGKKTTLTLASLLFTACSVASSLAPNFASFTVFRCLTAFQGTAFLTVGQGILRDIYPQEKRSRACSYFLIGTLIGPSIGPLTGGIIVAHIEWWWILVVQSGLAAIGCAAIIFFVKETLPPQKLNAFKTLERSQKVKLALLWCNPWRSISVWRYKNVLISGWASSTLVWNMYTLLTPIRYVLNPRFDLTSPQESGLFFLAPGVGYLLGAFFGGKYGDYNVRKWKEKRNGVKVPEDRLRSTLVAMGFVTPCCMLLYGWTIEKKIGGIPLPATAMVVQGISQLFCFTSINAYLLDAIPNRHSDVVAGNYLMRYLFAALGSGVCLPIIEQVGVGWFSTVTACLVFSAAIGTALLVKFGPRWREKLKAVPDR